MGEVSKDDKVVYKLDLEDVLPWIVLVLLTIYMGSLLGWLATIAVLELYLILGLITAILYYRKEKYLVVDLHAIVIWWWMYWIGVLYRKFH